MADSFFPYKDLIPPSTQGQPNHEIVGGRYELLSLIGQGSMSRVYQARDRVLGRIVAVKLLREEYGSDQNFVARFYREAHAVALLSSPNLVDIYDYGQHAGTYFIAMQYIEGTDLKSMLRHDGPLPYAQVVGIVNQVLEALAVAHSHNIIHRDVKPQNILVRASDGLVKLTDFGVAHARDGVNITTSGTAVGTAFYMAPEQAKGGPVSPATDLYAVGIVLFELLSGQLPFFGTNPLQIMYQHLHDRPPTFASTGMNVPPQLEQVVQRALAKDPAQRYGSAALMQVALTSAMTGVAAQGRTNAHAARRAANVHSGSGPASGMVTNPNNINSPPAVVPVSRRANLALPFLLGLFLLLLLGVLIGLGLLIFPPSSNKTVITQVAVAPTVTATTNPTTTLSILPATTTTALLPATVITSLPVATAIHTSAPATSAVTVALPTFTSEPVPTTNTPVPLRSTATRALPTATRTSIPTATPEPQPTPQVGNLGSPISPYSLSGSYKRDDGMLYGRPEVALYGAGTKYPGGTVNFNLHAVPDGKLMLNLTGIDDERAAHCTLQVTINGTIVFSGPNTFPNAPGGDNGEGGSDRLWGQMQISVPPDVLKSGSNTLVLSNTTPSTDQIGIPYILINAIQFEIS